jgi:hypothetical protein
MVRGLRGLRIACGVSIALAERCAVRIASLYAEDIQFTKDGTIIRSGAVKQIRRGWA